VKGILRYLLTLGVVLKSYLLAPFVPAQRGIMWLISRNSRVGALLGDTQPDWIPAIPERSATEFCRTDKVTIPFAEIVAGNVSAYELTVLGALAAGRNVRSIFEIGTFNGLTALVFAVNSAAGAKVFTLDLPPDNTGTKLPVEQGDHAYIPGRKGSHLQRGVFPEETKVTTLYGDSATFDYAPYANATDLVFVDGAHSYEYAMADSMTALKLLRGGRGTIVWHDYNTYWPGVIRAMEELRGREEFRNLAHIAGTSILILQRD
jgi:hypothetical protein